MSKVNQASAAALAGIEIAEKRIQALAFAMNGLNEYESRQASDDYSKLWSILHKNLNEQYRRFLMWGVIKPELRLEAKKKAMEHYLKKSSEIMSYLNPGDRTPSGYFSEEKEQFRKEIEELSKEIEQKKKVSK